MNSGVLKLKGFDKYTYVFMGIQLVLLLGIMVILLSAIAPTLDVSTIISGTLILMLVIPLLVLLYTSSADRTVKELLLGLLLSIVLLSSSGVIWYILSDKLNVTWIVPAAKIIMVVSYFPLLYVLYDITKGGYKKIGLYPKAFFAIVNVICIILITYYTFTRFNTGNEFDIIVYYLAVCGDIITLALASMLIVTYKPILVRYLLAVIFIYVLFSIAGDSLSLASVLRMDVYTGPGISQFFYNSMLVFLTVALVIYSFFKNFNKVAVDEVNRKLDDTRHTMEDLIMHMPDATCVFNPAGEIIMLNDPFLGVFGVGRQEVINTFNLFRHAGMLKCGMRENALLLKKGETIFIDRAEILFPGNRLAYLSMKVFPTFSQDREISGYIAITEDITARVRAEGELKRAKELVELYIDLLGHDINNMNQVGMGYLEIALSTIDLGDDNKKLLAKPLEAMKNSSRLIDNVKKLRRADDGDMHLRPMDVNKLLKEVIAQYDQAPDKEVSIQYDGGDAMVLANELLKDVFANLVSNAIKHSDGAIHISIRQEAVEADGKKCHRVVVEDDGPGIPDELKPIIFDRVLRRRARVGGNGIGLFLVKTLVDNFGGSIAVEDLAPGATRKGTRFIVILPAA